MCTAVPAESFMSVACSQHEPGLIGKENRVPLPLPKDDECSSIPQSLFATVRLEK